MSLKTTTFVSLPILAMGKPRMTQQDKWKKRPCVVRYRKFCDDLILLMKERNPEWMLQLTLGEVEGGGITSIVRIPMPKSWSIKKKEMKAGSMHDSKPDTSNIFKAIEDAVCVEDKQVALINCSKFWTCGDARVDMEILWKQTTI